MRLTLLAEESTTMSCVDGLIRGIDTLLDKEVELVDTGNRYVLSQNVTWAEGASINEDKIPSIDAMEAGGFVFYNIAKHLPAKQSGEEGIVLLTHNNFILTNGTLPYVARLAGNDPFGQAHYVLEIISGSKPVFVLGMPNHDDPAGAVRLGISIADMYGISLDQTMRRRVSKRD